MQNLCYQNIHFRCARPLHNQQAWSGESNGYNSYDQDVALSGDSDVIPAYNKKPWKVYVFSQAKGNKMKDITALASSILQKYQFIPVNEN